MIKDYVKEELVYLNLDVKDREELLEIVSKNLMEQGYVKDGFFEFINEREKNYPTGLDLETHAVAIPHGDPEYVTKPFISVVILKRPIEMQKMEDPTASVWVDLFFILGLNDGGQHLQILKQMIGIIQQQDFVESLKKTKEPTKVIQQIIETVS